jgi:hypothetical protein
MILYFENCFNERREIGRPESTEDIHKLIHAFLDDHNYKSYYTRMWVNDKGETYYDVGSHSEFFVMVEGEEDD